MLEGCNLSRAGLARRLGVSRARVTQVLAILDLPEEVLESIAALGDPLARPVPTERALRRIGGLPVEERERALAALVSTLGAEGQ